MTTMTYYTRRCDMTGDTWFVWCEANGDVMRQKVRYAGVRFTHTNLKRDGYTLVSAPVLLGL